MSSAIQDNHVQCILYEELKREQEARVSKFVDDFKKNFKREPQYIICSPGRINLIGDHIDYHGFAVLPMAIERSILLGCCFDKASETKTHGLVLANCADAYPPAEMDHSFLYGRQLDKSHHWFNYILCGYHGVLANSLLDVKPDNIYQHAHQTSVDALEALNFRLLQNSLPLTKILVDSDLPAASGLSSSSALVCGAAIAARLMINQYKGESICDISDRRELADACSKFEHLIGTHGGGMDQAVIMTAQQDYAKYVEFVPILRCENVRLPDDTVWLVSHSGVHYPKAATSGYNARVLETKLGAAIIAKSINSSGAIKLDRSINLNRIKTELFSGVPTEEIVEYIREKVFKHENKFSIEQVCDLLEMSRSKLIEEFNTSDEFLKNELGDQVELLNRCEHVFEEAERVEKFRSICDTTTDIGLLGQLMTQSHYSLRDKYSCSHPALDRLVSVSLDAGALGSRLTGAGWGGCIVTLVESSKCETVFDRLKEVSQFTFRTEPQSGCKIIRMGG